MNNLSDAEIIKALECCSEKECTQCPAFDDDIECGEAVIRLAINLINRLKAKEKEQQAEIEKLTAEVKKLKRDMSYMSSPNTIGDRHEMGCW